MAPVSERFRSTALQIRADGEQQASRNLRAPCANLSSIGEPLRRHARKGHHEQSFRYRFHRIPTDCPGGAGPARTGAGDAQRGVEPAESGGEPDAVRSDDRRDQLLLRRRVVRGTGPQPHLPVRLERDSELVPHRKRDGIGEDERRSEGRAIDSAPLERETRGHESRCQQPGRSPQRRLLGNRRAAEHPVHRVVIRQERFRRARCLCGLRSWRINPGRFSPKRRFRSLEAAGRSTSSRCSPEMPQRPRRTISS